MGAVVLRGILAAIALSAVPSSILSATGANAYWPTYGAAYDNDRHVDLPALNASSLARLRPLWRYVLGPHERVETTPIVTGGTMYVTTGAGNDVIALNARTGKQKWRFHPKLGAMSPCCGALNRGVAVGDGRVYSATLDGQLIALAAGSGKPIWHVQVGDGARGFSETMAPLYWNGVVFVGSSGSDFGIRGSVTAYRASTGARVWRWYSVGPGWEGRYVTSVNGFSLHRNVAAERRADARYSDAWQHGGGAVWMTPALDASSATLFVATANPNPVFDGADRPGDNLYTDSIVAIDARTGRMRWYYQQTPHDVWEYEAASPPILLRAAGTDGRPVSAVAQAGKTRWLYVLDRSTGRLLRISEPWSANADLYKRRYVGSDPKNALPLRGTIGPIAYDPGTRLAYVTEIDRPDAATWRDLLVAIGVDDGRIRWRKMLGPEHHRTRGDPVLAGALSTGDVVFVADPHGEFQALSAATGAPLWRYQLGSAAAPDSAANPFVRFAHAVRDWLLPLKRAMFGQSAPTQASAEVDTSPIAYQIDGRPYIAIGYDSEPERASGGATITAFAP